MDEARLGAIVGEMWAEMKRYAAKAKGAADTISSWMKTCEKVEKIWDAIKPWLSPPPPGG